MSYCKEDIIIAQATPVGHSALAILRVSGLSLNKLHNQLTGSKKIKPSNLEIKMRKKFRRSIVANQMIKRGTKITSNMLSLKRPGTGLHPVYLSKIIGRISNKSFNKNEKIKL